jgi:hypothetical protein
MIRLATGVTPNYLPRAAVFLESLHKCNVPSTLFAVNFDRDPPGLWHVNQRVLVDYRKATIQLPKFMLQHGGFVQFAPECWADRDIIIFTDADAILQRSFTEEELQSLRAAEGEFLVGYNRPNDNQTLDHEASCLQPKVPLSEVYRRFPGTDKIPCRNFGFVSATFASWKELFRRTVALEGNCSTCFWNPARVQFMACYAIGQPGLRFGDLSPVVHAHGHLGLKHGLEKRADGLWYQDGQLVAFAHAL